MENDKKGASIFHAPCIIHFQFSILHSRSALDCFGLRPRNDGHLRFPPSLRAKRSNPGDIPFWIASGCALTMTAPPATQYPPRGVPCGVTDLAASCGYLSRVNTTVRRHCYTEAA
ncbi:MAG: hypothetical protein LBT00_11130 [Spirochaetaceae bacterium]|nr:hypothetical protein [Spirochaetaceae bacterium]